MSHVITVEHPQPEVSVVSFADPARSNQVCWAAIDQLATTLKRCREEGARIVILASSLECHWFEHAWLQDLANGVEGMEQTGVGMGWFDAQAELTHPEVISIAAIAGDTSGGGAELGWACDLRIAEEQVRFSQPEINMALSTGIGGCSRIARLAGPSIAAEMVFLGKPVSAARLYMLGAINEVVAPGEALNRALALAARLAEKSIAALATMKGVLQEGEALSLPEALALEQSRFQSLVVNDAALRGMRAIQARYDAGESIAQANEYDD